MKSMNAVDRGVAAGPRGRGAAVWVGLVFALAGGVVVLGLAERSWWIAGAGFLISLWAAMAVTTAAYCSKSLLCSIAC